MKKLIVSGVIALSLTAGVASAQTYYPYSQASGGCISVSQYLSTGSRGSQVLALQQFLVSQNYPGSGAWMETSYFGQATAAAVRDFQQSQGLPVTGVVDASTQAALSRVSCGTSSYPYNTTYPYGTTYPNTTPYVAPYSPTYPYNYSYGSPVISSLSINTGGAGTPVTIQGSNFDPANNTVYFGSTPVANIPSSGTSLTFTVPQYAGSGNTNVYVTDSRGTSNSLQFNYIANNYACNSYSYSSCGCNSGVYNYGYSNTGNCGGCPTYPYGYGSTGSIYPYVGSCGTVSTNGTPVINYINPQSGGVGTSVTVYGSGFSTSGNTIHFGQGIITGAISSDGQGVSFVVPSQLTGYGSTQVTLGTYNISVTNAYGITSNVVPFTITSIGSAGAPTITNVSGPTSLAVNATGVWNLSLNTQSNSYTTVTVNWGDQNTYGGTNTTVPQTVYNQGTQNISFSHAYLTAGTYTITFSASNNSGASNTYTATVNVSGSSTYNSVPTVSYLSPNAAYIGQQVTINGLNFQSSGMTVNFGSGAIQNVSSSGSNITFTVPSYTTPYCTPGLLCGVQPTQVMPGTYNISVMDSYGTSNAVPFTVL